MTNHARPFTIPTDNVKPRKNKAVGPLRPKVTQEYQALVDESYRRITEKYKNRIYKVEGE